MGQGSSKAEKENKIAKVKWWFDELQTKPGIISSTPDFQSFGFYVHEFLTLMEIVIEEYYRVADVKTQEWIDYEFNRISTYISDFCILCNAISINYNIAQSGPAHTIYLSIFETIRDCAIKVDEVSFPILLNESLFSDKMKIVPGFMKEKLNRLWDHCRDDVYKNTTEDERKPIQSSENYLYTMNIITVHLQRRKSLIFIGNYIKYITVTGSAVCLRCKGSHFQ